jgi:hypothetical protein
MNPNAKVTSYNAPLPYVYVENLYTDKELQLIYDELDFYQKSKEVFFEDANETASALNASGKSMKKNGGFFLQHVYTQAKSPIGRFTSGIFGPKVFQHDSNYFFNEFAPQMTGFLVSYYEDKDYYKPHRDLDVATMCIWVWKEPKKFTGGEFSFTDFPDVKFETANNCAILFPGQYRHQVNPIKMDTDAAYENGWGRYSFTLFLDHMPTQRQQPQPRQPQPGQHR